MSSQCQATTLSGTQCSRFTSENAQFCWQHKLVVNAVIPISTESYTSRVGNQSVKDVGAKLSTLSISPEASSAPLKDEDYLFGIMQLEFGYHPFRSKKDENPFGDDNDLRAQSIFQFRRVQHQEQSKKSSFLRGADPQWNSINEKKYLGRHLKIVKSGEQARSEAYVWKSVQDIRKSLSCNIELSSSVPFVTLGFGGSIMKAIRRGKSIVYAEKVVSLYDMEITANTETLDLDYAYDRTFLAALDELKTETNPESSAFKSFIGKFGTHYAQRACISAKRVNFVEKEFSDESNEDELKLSVKASVAGEFSGGTTRSSSKSSSTGSHHLNIIGGDGLQDEKEWEINVKKTGNAGFFVKNFKPIYEILPKSCSSSVKSNLTAAIDTYLMDLGNEHELEISFNLRCPDGFIAPQPFEKKSAHVDVTVIGEHIPEFPDETAEKLCSFYFDRGNIINRFYNKALVISTKDKCLQLVKIPFGEVHWKLSENPYRFECANPQFANYIWRDKDPKDHCIQVKEKSFLSSPRNKKPIVLIHTLLSVSGQL